MARERECKVCNIAAGLGVATSICHQMNYASLDCEKLKEDVIQGKLGFFDFMEILKKKAEPKERVMLEELERLAKSSE